MKRITLAILLTVWTSALAACGSSSGTSSGSGGSGSTSNGPAPKLCYMHEFKSRPDGIPGLQTTYGDVWGKYHNVSEIGKTAESDLKNNNCDAGEVFTTDSGIGANSLVVLKDDKGLFPADNLGLIVRSEILKKYPQIAAIIDPIAARLTTDEFLKLNKAVEIDNQKPADVARAWLQANGFSGAATGTASSTGSGSANCPAPAAGAPVSGGGATLRIGSKSFAEEQISAEIAKQALTANGFTVDFSTQEADPQIGTDLAGGKIDLLWQYTGTELQTYLAQDKVPSDLHEAFVAARQLDDAKGLCWVGETTMNDTNGIAIRQADSAKFGTTLTQFTQYLQNHNS